MGIFVPSCFVGGTDIMVFVKGQKAWNEGVPMSRESKLKLSNSIKRLHHRRGMYWQNQKYKKKMLRIRRTQVTADVKERLSSAQKKRLQNPEVKKKLSEKSKKAWQDPKYREKMKKRNYAKTDEHKRKIGLANRGKKRTDETKRKISTLRQRIGSPWFIGRQFSDEARAKMSESARKRAIIQWQDESYKERMIKAMLKGLFKRPTKLEKRTIDFFEKYNLPFTYCGDGGLIIGGKCPDFYENNGKKICLEVANKVNKEVFGKNPDTYEKERIEHFGKYGWKCLVIWEDELKDEKSLMNKVETIL